MNTVKVNNTIRGKIVMNEIIFNLKKNPVNPGDILSDEQYYYIVVVNVYGNYNAVNLQTGKLLLDNFENIYDFVDGLAYNGVTNYKNQRITIG